MNVCWLSDKAYWATMWYPHAPMTTRRIGVNKYGRVYVPAEYRAWKQFLVRTLTRAGLGKAPSPAQWEIACAWYGAGEASSDLDNAIKPVIDACAAVLRVDDKAHLCKHIDARYVNLRDAADELVVPLEPGLWLGVTCHYGAAFSREDAAQLFPESRLWGSEDEIPF